MAQKIQTLFIDDLDGSAAEGTVRFSLDGTEYEIDLNNFLKHGKMESNPKLRPGDTITVQNKSFTGRDVSLILSFVTALGTLVLLYYTIQNESTRSTNN